MHPAPVRRLGRLPRLRTGEEAVMHMMPDLMRQHRDVIDGLKAHRLRLDLVNAQRLLGKAPQSRLRQSRRFQQSAADAMQRLHLPAPRRRRAGLHLRPRPRRIPARVHRRQRPCRGRSGHAQHFFRRCIRPSSFAIRHSAGRRHHHPHRRAHRRAVDPQACALRFLRAARTFQQHGARVILGHHLRLELLRCQRRVLLPGGGEDLRERDHLRALSLTRRLIGRPQT